MVAKEVKRIVDEDLFAATPPLEAKKLLFSMATTSEIAYDKSKGRSMKIDFIDVRRAYYQADARRNI